MADLTLLGPALLLVIVAAAVAMVEAALSRVSRVVAEDLQRQGRPAGQALASIVADPAPSLNLLLLLRLACELAATALVAVFVVHRLGAGFATVATVAAIMTVVSYVVVGVAPRTLGRQKAVTVALRAARPTRGITRVLGPLARLLILLGNAVTPGRGYRDGPFANEAELRDLVEQAEERGVVGAREGAMIAGVFELGDTLVRDVMVPRPDIVFTDAGKTVRQALALALRSGFSRLPVVGENTDDVVGIAYVKDLARAAQEGREERRVTEVLRAPVFVPDSKPADELLREMQAARTHVAIVVDEYGGTAGMVTIEDILEEIVGEIADEYDREMAPVEELSDGSVRVTARLPVDDLAELFDVELPSVDVETVGGLLADQLGRVPIPGSTVQVNGLQLTAESAAGRRNRIGTVVVRRVPAAEESVDAGAAAVSQSG